MGHRTVKRVPLDFDWPLDKVWPGFCLMEPDEYANEDQCPQCPDVPPAEWDARRLCAWHKIVLFNGLPDVPPPDGEGWQLWETTSEGSPVSPVFASAEELAEWCETGATWFGSFRGTREQWLRSFLDETTDIDSLLVVTVPEDQP